MSKKEILEQEQEVQEETEVQVSEEDQVELEELSTPGQGQSSTDKTNTGATGVSAAKRSLDKASPQDSMPTLAADQGAQEVGADPTMSGAEDGGKSTTKPNYASSVGKAKSGKMSESATRMGMIKDIYDLLQEMDKDSIEEVRKALSEEESSEDF